MPWEEDAHSKPPQNEHFHPPGIDCTRVKNSTVWDQQQQQQLLLNTRDKDDESNTNAVDF